MPTTNPVELILKPTIMVGESVMRSLWFDCLERVATPISFSKMVMSIVIFNWSVCLGPGSVVERRRPKTPSFSPIHIHGLLLPQSRGRLFLGLIVAPSFAKRRPLVHDGLLRWRITGGMNMTVGRKSILANR